MTINLDELTPPHIVAELDKYIIGQTKAKKAVAVALRNRTRRFKLSEEIREEIAPKNILMIGPTGVGKTEIARRLAKLSRAPFLKVEATKYTEVGYVGRDVESMIRDLMAVGYSMVKSEIQETLKAQAEKNTEEILLDLLLPGSNKKKRNRKEDPKPLLITGEAGKDAESENAGKIETDTGHTGEEDESDNDDMSGTREKFRKMLRDGKFEDKMVEISVQQSGMPSFEIFAGGSSMEDLESAMSNISSMLMGANKNKRKTTNVKEARTIIMDDQLDKLVDHDKIVEEAKERVEQMGIIFIDEIDKVASKSERSSGVDVSREGVQRDILPIVEGSKVNTKFGVVDTRHILFIAAGAFSISKPSDLIPEFQGRFPLRVELESLHAEDFKRILLEPKNALTKQYKALLETEGLTVIFKDEAIDRMSNLAAEVNSTMENIGARRLHTIMEMLLEDISFNASGMTEKTVEIDRAYVDERLKDIVQDQDLSRYIL